MPNHSDLAAIGLASLLSIAVTAQKPSSVEPAKKASPNAAVIYRRAIAEMNRVLTDPKTGEAAIPDDHLRSSEPHLTEEWAQIIKKCAVALTLFEQAAEMPECQFADDPSNLTWELNSESGVGTDYLRLYTIQHARGRQLVESSPRMTCSIGLQILKHSNHCARSRSIAGVQAHIAADISAAKLLQAAIRELPDKNDRSFAKRLLKQLESQLSNRLSTIAMADIAKLEFQQVLKLHYASFKDNKTFQLAASRAMEHLAAMFAPLRANPAIPEDKLMEHMCRYIRPLYEKAGDTAFDERIKTGRVEEAAALMAAFHCDPVPFMVLGSEHRTEVLNDCLDQLRKLVK